MEEYIRQIEETGRTQDPMVRNQICWAIENMARLLLKEDYFDPEKKEKELKDLQEFYKKFERKPILNPLPQALTQIQSQLTVLEKERRATSSNTDTSVVLPQTSFLHQLVSHFEDPKFVIGLSGPNGFQIKLPRYNVTLDVVKSSNDENKWEIHLAGTSLKLDLDQKNEIISGYPSPLIFTSGNEKRMILPIQRFVVEQELKGFSSKEETEYYNYVPDVSGKLKNFEMGTASHDVVTTLPSTEQFAQYIIKDDMIIPENREGGLYLAYVFLSKNQPEKAFEMLEYCENHFGPLSGSINEIDYITWMITAIPAKLGPASELNARIKNPEYMAVKLKALKFLSEFKKANPQFDIKTASEQDNAKKTQQFASIDKEYLNKQAEAREDFWGNTSLAIYEIFRIYNSVESNVPITLRLRDQDKHILLRDIYNTDKIKMDNMSEATGEPTFVEKVKTNVQLRAVFHRLEQSKPQMDSENILVSQEYYAKATSLLTETLKVKKERLGTIEKFANQLFDAQPTTTALVDVQLALLGRQKTRLKPNDLLKLYMNNDLEQTQKLTGLPEEQCKILHHMMFEALSQFTPKEQVVTVASVADIMPTTPEPTKPHTTAPVAPYEEHPASSIHSIASDVTDPASDVTDPASDV